MIPATPRYRLLPGWDALRTSGRLVLWTTLLLGILAAGALSAIGELAKEMAQTRAARGAPIWPATATRWLVIVPLAFVAVEGINTTPHPTSFVEPAVMRGVAGPVLVLPSLGVLDQNVMLWSTDGFPKVVNGSSGFTPTSPSLTRSATLSFPDRDSVAFLRDIGVRTVILLPDLAAGTSWADVSSRPVEGLGITRQQVGNTLVFDLSAAPR